MRTVPLLVFSSLLAGLTLPLAAQEHDRGLSRQLRSELRKMIREEVRSAVRDALEDLSAAKKDLAIAKKNLAIARIAPPKRREVAVKRMTKKTAAPRTLRWTKGGDLWVEKSDDDHDVRVWVERGEGSDQKVRYRVLRPDSKDDAKETRAYRLRKSSDGRKVDFLKADDDVKFDDFGKRGSDDRGSDEGVPDYWDSRTKTFRFPGGQGKVMFKRIGDDGVGARIRKVEVDVHEVDKKSSHKRRTSKDKTGHKTMVFSTPGGHRKVMQGQVLELHTHDGVHNYTVETPKGHAVLELHSTPHLKAKLKKSTSKKVKKPAKVRRRRIHL